jgi:hypothetical protein
MHAVYMTPLGLPTFQPDLEKAIAERLKVEFVVTRASTFDRTQLYLPTEIFQDVCHDTHLPRVVAANAVTTRPNGPNSSAIVLSVSVYDCVNNLFVNVAQSSTAVVPNTSPAVLNDEYRSALKRLLEQLSPPVVPKARGAATQPTYPLDVETAFPAPAGPPRSR